jgi:S1-C subfamily serine protease
MKQKTIFVTLIAVALLAGLVWGASLSTNASVATAIQSRPQLAATPSVPLANGSVAATSVAGLEAALEQIYAQVNPSVVAIEVTQDQAATMNNLPQGHPAVPSSQALGSGFVWDTNGYIVTNNHVVDGATRVSVTFSDGTIVDANVVGKDPDSDLAVVKVDVPADQLHPVQLADSKQVKVGELAVAIGNPFGEQNTFTVGFISALARSLPADNSSASGGSYTIPDIIQTDAPINPGNSGGVLVNDQGQVVGVTSAIESPVRASVGIGFAIPSAIVQKVVPELIKNGHYDHSYLGISGRTLTPDLASAMNLSKTQRGVLVGDVTSNGPAEKAGLKGSTQQTTINGTTTNVGGDVITAIDDQPVKTFDDLVAYLASSTSVNQTVTLTVLRNGQTQTIKVTLTARPQSQPTQTADSNSQNNNPFGNIPNPFGNSPFNPFGNLPGNRNNPFGGSQAGAPYLGIQGLSMTSDMAKAMNLSSDQQGVLIVQVSSNSPAEKAKLQGSTKSFDLNGQTIPIGGDVITAIDGQSVTTIRELQTTILQDKVGQTVKLTILRDGQKMDVSVTLEARPSSVQ